MMRLEQLEYLIEVYRTKSITAAGENLHVAQQGISKALHNLEIELGSTLFERTNKGILFTEIGEKTVVNAKLVLEQVERLRNDVLPAKRQARRNLSGTLRICSTPCLFTSLAPKIIAQFKHDYPKVELSYTENSLDGVFLSLQNKEMDIGFLSIEWRDDHLYPIADDLAFHVVQKDTPYAVIHKNLPLAKNKSISLSKLAQYPLTIYKPQFAKQQPLYKILLAQPDVYKFVYFDDLISSCQEIILGNCVGLSSRMAQQHTLLLKDDQLISIPIRDGIKTAVGYCLRKDAQISALTTLFIKQFEDLCNVSK